MAKLTITVTPDDLDEAYRRMAADEEREGEALAWAEGLINDVAEEPPADEAETAPS